MKILVIFTGGTIGSKETEGWIAPDKATKYALIENYRSHKDRNTEFYSEEPYFILSENLAAENINCLVSCVCENLKGDYDGIIITHGTDTLQFSAAAISYAVGSESIPVLFVSANYPLDDPRSNGDANFEGAVEFIKQGCGNGVFISYKNRFDRLKFHSGLNALSYGEADDRIHSLYDEHYAVFEDKGINICGAVEKFAPLSPFNLTEHHGILTVCAVPEDDFDYDIKKYNAVIIRPYHSGTLNTANVRFKDFCLKAKEQNLPVFVCGVHSGADYESSKLYDELGLIPLSHMTYSRAFMRLWIGISRGENLKNLF